VELEWARGLGVDPFLARVSGGLEGFECAGGCGGDEELVVVSGYTRRTKRTRMIWWVTM